MALYRYLKPVSDAHVPDPNGPLSKSMSSQSIKDANRAITQSAKSTSRGTYAKITPQCQAEIAEYALLHGNRAATRRYSKELEVELKESSVATWKKKYQDELKRVAGRVSRDGGVDHAVEVKVLPLKKRGRPLLLGEKLDSEVKAYLKAVRDAGGVVTTSITIAAGTAIVRRSDRNLLAENGGPITLTTNWAKSLLYRLNFVKRRGSSAALIAVKNFEELKEQFLLDISAVVEMEDVPPQLVINWDQTGISIVPGSSWTMELKGSKRVEIAGISDKRQITAVLCGTMGGQILPF